MQFALSTHLFHGEPLAPAHLDAIAEAGFTDIEIFATRTHVNYADGRAVAALADAVRSAGLSIGSLHAPICASFVGGQWGRAFSNASGDARARQEAVDETTRAIDACRTFGARLLVLHLGLPRGQSIPAGDNDRRAVQRSLAQVAEAASRAGVQVALENIPNELSTPPALAQWLDGELELEATGVCLDVGHAHLMGGAPEAVEVLAGHLLTTHLHDNLGASDEHLVPFAGSIDWPATLTALWKVGFDGRLVFEVADHGDAGSVLQRTVGARRRLQAILEGLAEPFEFGGHT